MSRVSRSASPLSSAYRADQTPAVFDIWRSPTDQDADLMIMLTDGVFGGQN